MLSVRGGLQFAWGVAVLVGLAGCSSTTNVSGTGAGGAAGVPGSGGLGAAGAPSAAGAPGAAGESGVSGAAGAAGGGGSDCASGALLVPDLHAACIEDLGGGRLRMSYDFATAEQLEDWSPSAEGTIEVRDGALVAESAGSIGVAIFSKKLQVDRLSFRVILLSGNTTNWYVNTIWSGSWNPSSGFGGYHDATGRGFIINGVEYPPDDISPVAIGVEHTVTVTQTDSELAWDMDGDTITAAVAPSPVTDRMLALGAWTSVAAFYDVVFEGTLD